MSDARPRQEAENAAREIVDYFFTNGDGQTATRLVLELPVGRELDGGGWSRAAMIPKIAAALADAEKRGMQRAAEIMERVLNDKDKERDQLKARLAESRELLEVALIHCEACATTMPLTQAIKNALRAMK